MEKTSKIFVAGHRGLVGSAILENLCRRGYSNFILRTHTELDLTNQQAVMDFFVAEQPEYVFLAAAHVGGIMANTILRWDFISTTRRVQKNLVKASCINRVSKLVLLGST